MPELREVLDESGDSASVLMHFARMVTAEERQILSEQLARSARGRKKR